MSVYNHINTHLVQNVPCCQTRRSKTTLGVDKSNVCTVNTVNLLCKQLLVNEYIIAFMNDCLAYIRFIRFIKTKMRFYDNSVLQSCFYYSQTYNGAGEIKLYLSFKA